MPVHFHPGIDMGSSTFTTLLTRAGPTAHPHSPATQGDVLSILQQEQEHALSLLSLSPLLSSLFVSYASRAGARGSLPATAFAESEEWKSLQETIAALREENETFKLEAREMVRKLEMAEASQEMLRSQVSSLHEANAVHQEDVKSLRAENVETKEKYNRIVMNLEAEKATLKVQISDLEAQRGQLRNTAVKQQIRITKLERPSIDTTLPLRVPNSPPMLRDSDFTPSPSLPDSPVSPFHSIMSPTSSPRAIGRLPSSSSVVAGLRPHPIARGGLVPGRHKTSTLDLRSEPSLNRCNSLNGLHTQTQPIEWPPGELSPNRHPTLQTGPETPTAGQEGSARLLHELEGGSPDTESTVVSDSGAEVLHSPKIPEDIVNKILGSLVVDSGWYPERSLPKILQSCSLVSKSWVTPCQQYLFHTVIFDPKRMEKWLQTFPVPERSPAHHVQHLYLLVRWYRAPPEEFFRRTQWFTNAKKITVSVGDVSQSSLRIPPFARLPKSVTSLSIDSKTVDLGELRDVMLRLPALDHLSLSGSIAVESNGTSQGFGTVLRARFGGMLRLGPESIDEGIVNMLLEVPTGLHFTWVDIHVERECHSSVVRLTEACRTTLARLLYRVSVHAEVDGQVAFDKPFDLAGFPNLQEVSLNMRWIDGDLQWIPVTLATLKPKTSPLLSRIHLGFNGPMHPSLPHPGNATLERLGSNLQRIAAEFIRIERDFEGAVDLVVYRASGFARLDTDNALRFWDRRS